MYRQGPFFVAAEHEKIFATEYRRRDSHRKPNVNVKKIAVLDFVELTFLQGEDQPYLKIYFRRREELKGAGLNLAHCCGSIGLQLTRNENLSERVCRPCARKIRNAAQLYSFIEKAVSNTIVEEDLH